MTINIKQIVGSKSITTIDEQKCFPVDPLESWPLDILPIVLEYIGDKDDIQKLQGQNASFEKVIKEEDFAKYDPQYRESLIRKLSCARYDMTALLPKEQKQLLCARLLVAVFDFSQRLQCGEWLHNATEETINYNIAQVMDIFSNVVTLNINYDQPIYRDDAKYTYYARSIQFPHQLPQRVKKIRVYGNDTQVQEILRQIPEVTDLEIDGCNFKNVFTLSEKVSKLEIRNHMYLATGWLKEVLKQCPALEELSLDNGRLDDFIELPQKLKKLTIRGCWGGDESHHRKPLRLDALPRAVSLEEVRIHCRNPVIIPDFSTNVRILHCASRCLPQSFLQATTWEGLEELCLTGNVENLPVLPSLKRIKLDIADDEFASSIIASIAKAAKLEEVELEGHLPDNAVLAFSSSLQKLSLYVQGLSAKSLSVLPEKLVELKLFDADLSQIATLPLLLEKLSLFRCRSVRKITSAITRLSVLKALDLSETDISEIPFLPYSLRILKLVRCNALKTKAAIERISEARQLQKLDLSETPITSICVLPQSLEYLSLKQCLSLSDESLDRIENASALKELYLSCTNITRLYTLQRSLQRLSLGLCEKLLNQSIQCITKADNLQVVGLAGTHITQLPPLPLSMESVVLPENFDIIQRPMLLEKYPTVRFRCTSYGIFEMACDNMTLEL